MKKCSNESTYNCICEELYLLKALRTLRPLSVKLSKLLEDYLTLTQKP